MWKSACDFVGGVEIRLFQLLLHTFEHTHTQKQQKFEIQNTAKVNVWLLVIRNPYEMHMLFHWHKYNIQHHRTLQMFLFSLNAKSEFLSYEQQKFHYTYNQLFKFIQLILSCCSYFWFLLLCPIFTYLADCHSLYFI